MFANAHRHVSSPLQTPPIHLTAVPWVPEVTHTARRLGFDLNLVLAALSVASHAHAQQVRSADGSPYVGHVVAVAQAYAQHPTSHQAGFIAALLHDVLEDAPEYTSAVLTMFGPHVIQIVEAISKDARVARENRNFDVYDRLMAHLAQTQDPTAGLVKVADRCHNVWTSTHLPIFKRELMAKECQEWFAPLAQRLGCESLAIWLANPEQWMSVRTQGYLAFMHKAFMGARTL